MPDVNETTGGSPDISTGENGRRREKVKGNDVFFRRNVNSPLSAT
jgi:hypothetical protein